MARAHSKPKSSRRPKPLDLPGVSSRPAWQGTLRLSLVSCAVGLYRATTVADVSFHLINPDTGNRIKMVTTDPETGPVERSHLVKGFEVDKGNYVLLNDEELKSVKLETTRTLDIERFVDAKAIDRLYFDQPYILAPADESAAEAYGVIQQAMVAANKVALGRVTMHTREQLMAIEPRDNGLLATTLRMRNEVVNTAEALGAIPHGKADKQMIAIAQQIIGQQEGPFDPEEFTDRYEDALHDLIERKKKGQKIKSAPRPAAGNVIDLMDALKRSLGGRAAASKPAATRKKPVKKTASRR
ncbi:MAG: non-homologous end joining protein Ku [Rhodospirillaceae bacterium]